MQDLSGIPYAEVQFSKDGAIHDDQQVEPLLRLLDEDGVTDLFVIAHGWNNDMDDARRMYAVFFQRMREMLDEDRVPGVAGRKFAILGLLWPSKKFADSELIPSGAASFADPDVEDDPDSDESLAGKLDELKAMLDDPAAEARLEQAKGLIPALEDDPEAAAELANLVRGVLPTDARDEEDASAAFFSLGPGELMERLGEEEVDDEPVLEPEVGGAASVGLDTSFEEEGGAARFDPIGRARRAVRNLLNFTTYYQMKERAGTVGRKGANQVLRRVREGRDGLKVHLIGHSFGARLVTAAVVGPGGQATVRPDTLTLLQAAFSHNGFASRWDGSRDGLFRSLVVDRLVQGPVLISYTEHDTAVGIAYPIASKIMQQTAARLGDRNDPYGGLGRNGAQNTPEAVDRFLLAVGGGYDLQTGTLYNLNADDFIANHGDICKNEVAYAVLSAAART
jgi:hypothetical protein